MTDPYTWVTPRMRCHGPTAWAVACDDGRVVTANDPLARPNEFRVGDMLLLVRWEGTGWTNLRVGELGTGWAPDGEYDMERGLHRIVVRDGRIVQTLVDQPKAREREMLKQVRSNRNV